MDFKGTWYLQFNILGLGYRSYISLKERKKKKRGG